MEAIETKDLITTQGKYFTIGRSKDNAVWGIVSLINIATLMYFKFEILK